MSTAVSVRIGAGGTGQTNHDLRIGPQPDYVDQSRSHLNRLVVTYQNRTWLRDEWQRIRDENGITRKMRKDQCLDYAGIITFGHQAQAIFERLNETTQDVAYLEVAEAIAERLNTTVTGLVVHCDETAPHAHFKLLGIDRDGRPLSYKLKRGMLASFQTLAAELIAQHAPEITRGKRKVDRIADGDPLWKIVNRSVAELHHDLPLEYAAKTEELEAKISQLAARLEKNERLAARALEKVAANEDRAEKAAKNAEIYERRALAARAELEAAQRALNNLNDASRAVVKKEEERLKLLREQQALAQNEARKARTEAAERLEAIEQKSSDLATREHAIAKTEAVLVRREELLARGAKNLQSALNMALDGTHDREITEADMPDDPGKFAVLRKFAPDGRPTRGWRAKFWSLNYSDTGAPVSEQHLPAKIRDSLSQAFDRVAAWAKEIAAQLTAREQKLAQAEQTVALKLQNAEKAAATLAEKAKKQALDSVYGQITAAHAQATQKASQIIEEATEKAAKIDTGVVRKQAISAFALLRDTLRNAVGEAGYTVIAQQFERQWAQHPDNQKLKADFRLPPNHPSDEPMEFDPDMFPPIPREHDDAYRFNSGPSGP